MTTHGATVDLKSGPGPVPLPQRPPCHASLVSLATSESCHACSQSIALASTGCSCLLVERVPPAQQQIRHAPYSGKDSTSDWRPSPERLWPEATGAVRRCVSGDLLFTQQVARARTYECPSAAAPGTTRWAARRPARARAQNATAATSFVKTRFSPRAPGAPLYLRGDVAPGAPSDGARHARAHTHAGAAQSSNSVDTLSSRCTRRIVSAISVPTERHVMIGSLRSSIC